MTDGPVETLASWVLDEQLLPLAAIRIHTRAGLCQLNDGVAHGCAAAFCIASRRGGDVDALQDAYRSFLAASHGGLDRLGDMIRLREDGREALFYLRNTSAEVVKCSSRCLDSVEDRITAYRQMLRGGVVPI